MSVDETIVDETIVDEPIVDAVVVASTLADVATVAGADVEPATELLSVTEVVFAGRGVASRPHAVAASETLLP